MFKDIYKSSNIFGQILLNKELLSTFQEFNYSL